MKLPPERAGSVLKIRSRELPFSFFPMARTNRRWGLNSMLYAAEPWAVISGAIRDAANARSLPQVEETSALSFVRQAKEYFVAAERAGAIETRPLLYYYSFLNLAKALSIAGGRKGMVGKVKHGIAAVHSSGYSPTSAEIVIQRSGADDPNVIDELNWALEGRAAPARQIKIADVMPHSVVGHRMWRAATASVRKERFLALDEIHWLDNETAREIWLKLYVRRDNLQSHGRGVTETLREARIDSAFRAVNDAYAAAHDFHAFEQVVATPYTGRASDVVMETVANVRRDIWQTVTSTRPFRRFYLYLSPLGEFRLPQWVSTYSLLFWLGSLTRYQPVELLEALTGAYGPFFEEFIETQLAQLLYFLASEARAQDISKPALVWVYLTRASPEPIDASNADRRHYARLPPTFPARPHPSLRQIADTRHPREVADGVDEESCVANFPYTPRLGPSDAPAFSGARALIAHPVLYRDVRFSCNHRQMQPRTRDARRLG